MDIGALISLISAVATPTAIIFVSAIGVTLVRKYIDSKNDINGPSINISNTRPSEEQVDRSGYAFIEVPDEKKSIFADAMQGFRDFAKLKGYNVDCSLDTSFANKVGVRFTILDQGVTVSTATVRDDVKEYLDKIKNGEDLSDMPIAQSDLEHQQLLAGLQARMSFLRHQAELQAIKNDFYKGLITDWTQLNRTPIAYAPNLQLTFQNEGARLMRDSYNAENSSNVAQGSHAVASNTGTIRIGATHSERNTQIASLKSLEEALSQSSLPEDKKEKATRHVQNAREELE